MGLESIYDGVLGPRWELAMSAAAGDLAGWGALNKFGANAAILIRQVEEPRQRGAREGQVDHI